MRTDTDRATSSLLSLLEQKMQERGEEAVNSIDFSHSSRNAWSTIKKLTGRSGRSSCLYTVSANSIASQLVKNGTHRTRDRKSTRFINKELSDLWKITTPEGHSISELFRPEKLAAVLRRQKPGKSPGLDSIFPEFVLHARSALKSWFCDVLTSCMHQLKIPKICRRALIVAIPKPENPLESQRATVLYLCCVSPLKSSRDASTLVSKQSSTHCSHKSRWASDRRSSVDQVNLLTQDIRDSFLAKMKTGVVFGDLTAAYDNVWHRSLTCKLLRLPPDRHMVHMIMEMVGNRSFTINNGNGKR